MAGSKTGPTTGPATGYVTVNGLKMYHEIHGEGEPLVMLHGGFMTIDALGPIVPAMAETRKVIAVEMEGHGRTADLDRPLDVNQFADDVAGLLDALGVDKADVFGFSLGGMTALGMAVRHPERVGKIVAVSAGYNGDAFYPSIKAQWPEITPESLAGSPMEEAYKATAPDIGRWPVFVGKMMNMLTTFQGWPADDIRAIEAPVMLIYGDADLIPSEHWLDLFRLLGGARDHGGMGPLPESRMAVLPGTTHFDIIYKTDVLAPMVNAFLNADGPPAQGPIMRSGVERAN